MNSNNEYSYILNNSQTTNGVAFTTSSSLSSPPLSATTNYFSKKMNKFYEKENNNEYEVDLTYLNAIRKLNSCGYYWGPINYEFAEKLLKNRDNGSFLLRDSKHDNYLFTITFKSNDYIYHVRIEHICNGLFNFQCFNNTIESKDIKSFIDTAIEKSRSGHSFFINPRENSPGMHVKFLYPISRFKERPVCSLQHLARFEILKYVRKDNIDKLILPNKLKAYLKQSQIFVEFDTTVDK